MHPRNLVLTQCSAAPFTVTLLPTTSSSIAVLIKQRKASSGGDTMGSPLTHVAVPRRSDEPICRVMAGGLGTSLIANAWPIARRARPYCTSTRPVGRLCFSEAMFSAVIRQASLSSVE